jgi:hypothetical protein
VCVFVCVSIESSEETVGNINIYGIIRLTLYAATASAPSYAMLQSIPFRFKRMESILQLDTASVKAKRLKR